MNIDKLTELVNDRVNYIEIIKKLEDAEHYSLAIVSGTIYAHIARVLDPACKRWVIDYYSKKIQEIEKIIKRR